MKFDVNRFGMALAVAHSFFFTVGYLATVGVIAWRFHPLLHLMKLNGMTSARMVEFAAGEFLSGLVVFAVFGYLLGAIVAWSYNWLER